MTAEHPPRRKRLVRSVLVAIGLLGVVLLLAAVKWAQIRTLIGFGQQMEAAGPPPESVGSALAREEAWENTLAAIGSVAGRKSVALSSEVPGIVARLHFESGDLVRPGQILAELDTRVERAQVASAKVRRDFAVVTADRSRVLADRRAISLDQLDEDVAQLETARSDLAALEAQVERRRIRAPFAGRVGIREVKPGQFLNPGTTVTTIDAIGAAFVDFSLPQELQGAVSVGTPIRISARGGATAGEGTIAAVDPTLDEATRSLKLRATVPNPNGTLREGMFVNVSVILPQRQRVVVVPVTAIVHASYGDSVFLIEGAIARQQFVKLGRRQGDFVAISEGVSAGQTVVSEGAFKLRNGAPVVVDDRVKPRPQLNPTPPNR